MTAMISLRGVTKQYPGTASTAVHNIDLEIEEGETLVLLGPSGCGKTTTLEMINRLVQPTTGSILLAGEDTATLKLTDLRRRIGYVIQDAGLFPHRTVAQNIATVPELLHWDKARIAARVDELLAMVHLDPAQYRDRLPAELSGGQRQRVGVARALAADPDVILMDEPFGALDPITRDHLQSEFRRLQSEIKKTIVFVTHDIDEAVRMGDRIAVFGRDEGIVQLDTPMAILTRPVNNYVRDFIGSDSTMRALSLLDVPSDPRVLADDTVVVVTETELDAATPLVGGRVGAVLLVDVDARPIRWVAGGTDVIVIPVGSTLRTAVGALLGASQANAHAAVVDDDGRYLGVLTLERIHRAVRESGVVAVRADQ
jgi:osmoprotectant transport system ATP-binding protein